MNLPEQNNRPQKSIAQKRFRHIFELVLFAMLGTILFVSKIIMEALPNIHLLALLITVYTVVFRSKALIPIYIYVLLNGLFGGFSLWWVPYLYIWTILWGIVMLLPKRMPPAVACIVYSSVACLHGFLYGILYAPAQALLFGLNFEQTVAWIIAGFPFDLIHGISNFVVGFFAIPLIKVLQRAIKSTGLY